MTDIEIRQTRYLARTAQMLVAAAMADLTTRYGGGDESPVDAMEFDPPIGAFFVAFRADEPVGCAGWRSHGGSGDVAELKRMFVMPDARGNGLASTLLGAVEDSAAAAGRRRMILECGNRQPEAVALYEKLGYTRIPDFGYYRDEADVLSYGRDLLPPPPPVN